MLESGFAATAMLRLPRTAAPACGPTRETRSRQPPPPSETAEAGSPREVLSGLPLIQTRSKYGRRTPPPDHGMAVLEGHAQDVLHLLNASWFGPLSRSKAAELFRQEEPEAEPSLPPRRGRQQQQQQQQPRGDHASDASPSSSSQRSGSSSQVAAGVGSDRGGAAQARGSNTPIKPITLSRQQAAQAAAIQDLPGIGTWAGRYRLFGRQQPPKAKAGSVAAQQQQQQQQAERSSPLAAVAQPLTAEQQEPEHDSGDEFGSPVVLRPGGFGQPTAAPRPRGERQHGAYGSDEAQEHEAQEHAWRWRFSRKWATEQKRYYEQPELPTSVVSDDLDVMEFTQACGMGLNLQVMPTRRQLKPHAASAEEEGALAIDNSASTLSLCQFDVDHSESALGLLSAEISPCNSTHGAMAAARLLYRTGSGGGGMQPRQQQGQGQGGAVPSSRLPSATKSVLSMASRAQELLRKQGVIEQEVQDRWERSGTAGDAWAGRALRGVHIDMWGRFKYCVLRVSDGAGRTRFIVRGRTGATPAALLEAASLEAAEASRSGAVPAVMVEIVGAGIMEWREDTERELHLMPSTLSPGQVASLDAVRSGSSSDSPTKSAFLGDVTGLTASLVRQALPCHFRITTAGTAARAGSTATLGNRV